MVNSKNHDIGMLFEILHQYELNSKLQLIMISNHITEIEGII